MFMWVVMVSVELVMVVFSGLGWQVQVSMYFLLCRFWVLKCFCRVMMWVSFWYGWVMVFMLMIGIGEYLVKLLRMMFWWLQVQLMNLGNVCMVMMLQQWFSILVILVMCFLVLLFIIVLRLNLIGYVFLFGCSIIVWVLSWNVLSLKLVWVCMDGLKNISVIDLFLSWLLSLLCLNSVVWVSSVLRLLWFQFWVFRKCLGDIIFFCEVVLGLMWWKGNRK